MKNVVYNEQHDALCISMGLGEKKNPVVVQTLLPSD